MYFPLCCKNVQLGFRIDEGFLLTNGVYVQPDGKSHYFQNVHVGFHTVFSQEDALGADVPLDLLLRYAAASASSV